MMSFKEFLAVREGVFLPDRPPASGLSKINATGMTNDQRKKLVPKLVKAPPLVPPFKSTVPQVVPNSLIPKLGSKYP